jgi:hypothetical protein
MTVERGNGMMRTWLRRWLSVAVIALCLVGVRPAGAQDLGTPVATPAAGATMAVYLTIANDSCLADRLIGARSEVADTVVIHETVEEDDRIVLRPLPGCPGHRPGWRRACRDGNAACAGDRRHHSGL